MVGGILRYSIGLLPVPTTLEGFPLWTLVINMVGCFFIGFLTAFTHNLSFDYSIAKGLTTGLCGGFTSFSTFSQDAMILKDNGATGLFVIYLFLSLVLGVSMVYAGRSVAHLL